MINIDAIDWPELTPGILIKRYKRFMVDVKLKKGSLTLAGSKLDCRKREVIALGG